MQNELYEKLSRLQWLLHRQQIRGWAENGPLADTTRGQGRILALLKMRDGISTRDLSYLLGVRISSLNELLSKLERAGYVTREPSEQDKRVMLVKLTEKGRNEQQPDPVDYGDVFSCLSDDDQKKLGEYLDQIIKAFHERVGDVEEEWVEKMSSLHERLGDMGEFFGKRGREFFGRRGFPHDPRMSFWYGGFSGRYGCHNHGGRDDE
ncbi:MAG: MarR family transcriptional regulator [Oscillospiraceae bacterium]|nr:MarR family transcriptional regulator [Oscillospiraceae bacterium]